MGKTKEPRWERRKAERPDEILDAALECFADRGFAATRMDEVAARAGVTKGTVYLYFRTKEDLFKELVRTRLSPHIAAVESAAAAGAASTGELLQRLFQVWTERLFPSKASILPKLIIAEAGNFPDLAAFYLKEVIHRGIGLLRNLVKRGVAAGEFRPVDADHVAYCIVAPLLFSVLWRHSFERHDTKPLDVAALGKAHLDLLLHGLLKPKRAANSRPAAAPRRKRGVQ
jgi:AcrR family transcriptional regulator